MRIYIHQSHLRINLLFCLSLASCRAEPRPAVSRVWPELGAMLSAAAWSPDTARVARALAAAHEAIDRLDSLLQRRVRIAALDSAARETRRSTGVALAADSFAAGYALDRAALVLAPAVDSALLALGRPGHATLGGHSRSRQFAAHAGSRRVAQRIHQHQRATPAVRYGARRGRTHGRRLVGGVRGVEL